MNRNRRVGSWVMAMAVVLVVGYSPAAAGVDISFGANIPVGDDGELYVAISSRYFDRDHDTVRQVAVRYDNPDDLAVALFVSRHSGQNADQIWQLRRQGRSWWQISAHLGLNHDVWFVPVERAPGPPYGKAYGYWKKHRQNRRAAFTLSDADARNLVAVRMISDYYDLSIEAAMEKRAGGNLRHVLAHEYHSRHPHGKIKGKPKHAHRGKGHRKR
ncbi:MAG: hypothetical protein OEV00_11370 [Acidobacteriota bacterium]|nr:hypothetical protein [Acidobacteriota bacterium]MDH3785913.1 hypothetical protein [Acidobacteriota bacterium]